MSSSDRLNPQQLQMFMPAGELKSLPSAQVWMGHSWEQILLESRDRRPYHRGGATTTPPPEGSPTLYEDIRDKGVSEPVDISRDPEGAPMLRHGHHRVAVSADIDPKREIPVKHYGLDPAFPGGTSR
jgi:hypothetical protein